MKLGTVVWSRDTEASWIGEFVGIKLMEDGTESAIIFQVRVTPTGPREGYVYDLEQRCRWVDGREWSPWKSIGSAPSVRRAKQKLGYYAADRA